MFMMVDGDCALACMNNIYLDMIEGEYIAIHHISHVILE